MGRSVSTAVAPAFEPARWRRERRRRWRRPGDLAGMAMMVAAIPWLPRAGLSLLTTRMIDRMDEIDGDPDAEDGGDDEDNHDREQDADHV